MIGGLSVRMRLGLRMGVGLGMERKGGTGYMVGLVTLGTWVAKAIR